MGIIKIKMRISFLQVNLQNNPQAELQAHMKLFRAERNMYMSGFSLFMLVVLRRLVMLITRQAQVEASNQAALKQAQGASEQARKLMQENEDLLKGNISVTQYRILLGLASSPYVTSTVSQSVCPSVRPSDKVLILPTIRFF